MNNWLLNNFMQQRITEDINKMVIFESIETAVNNMNNLVETYNKFFGQEVIRWNLKNADPTNFDMDVYVGGNVYNYKLVKSDTITRDVLSNSDNV